MDGAESSDRGATGVEVALIITFVALVVMGAVTTLGKRSNGTLETTGKAIEKQPAVTRGGGGGGGGGGGSTSDPPPSPTSPPSPTIVPTPPTTSAPTTTAAPTTTTAPPTTTTTTPPTTTTTAPPTATGSFGATSSYVSGYRQWSASTTLSLDTATGAGVPGAQVTLTVAIQHTVYGWRTETVTATTGADGTVEVTVGPYDNYGSYRDLQVLVTVASVTPPDGTTWDGSSPSTTAAAP